MPEYPVVRKNFFRSDADVHAYNAGFLSSLCGTVFFTALIVLLDADRLIALAVRSRRHISSSSSRESVPSKATGAVSGEEGQTKKGQ